MGLFAPRHNDECGFVRVRRYPIAGARLMSQSAKFLSSGAKFLRAAHITPLQVSLLGGVGSAEVTVLGERERARGLFTAARQRELARAHGEATVAHEPLQQA